MTDSPSFRPLSRYAAVIPAYNEGMSIAGVVSGVRLFSVPIVVDDGSTDDTALLAERAGAVVVKHESNRGYDAALESGLFKAINMGFQFAVTIDADGQHAPQTLVAFNNELDSGADLVVGTRDSYQRLSESFFALISKMLWGVNDPLCGMKGYRLDHLASLGHFDSYQSIGTEFMIRCARSKMTITSVSVPTRPRLDKPRFGAGLIPNLKILRAMFLGLIRATAIDHENSHRV